MRSVLPFLLLAAGTAGAVPQGVTPLTAAQAKALLPEAAGVPADFLKRVAEEGTVVTGKVPPNGHSLTWAILTHAPPREPVKDPEFKFLAENAVNVGAVMAAISKSGGKGYGSVIQPEFITDCTCTVKGDTATGVVTFKADKAYQGKVEYTARVKDGKWRVEEFRMPNLKIAVKLGADGKWVKQ
jgi:hypothetical protein